MSIVELKKDGIVPWKRQQTIPSPYKLSTFQMYNVVNCSNFHVLKKKKESNIFTTLGIKELPPGTNLLVIDLNNYNEIPEKYFDVYLDSKAKKQIKAARELQQKLGAQNTNGQCKESESSGEESSESDETESEKGKPSKGKLRVRASIEREKELEKQRVEYERMAERRLKETRKKEEKEAKKQRLREDQERERQRLEEEQRLREETNERLRQELLVQVQTRENQHAVQSIVEQPTFYFNQHPPVDNNNDNPGFTQEDAHEFQNYQDFFTTLANDMPENQETSTVRTLDFVDAQKNTYHFHFHLK